MRPSNHMARLHSATQYRLRRFLRLYRSSNFLPRPQQAIQLSHIVIEFDNLNISTLRGFTISTLRGAKTVAGNRVNVVGQFHSEEQIGAYILSVLSPMRFRRMRFPNVVQRTEEITVRDPKDTEKVLLSSSASNLTSLQSALALNSSLFRDLKHLRHFYAHRNSDTFAKAKTFGVSLGLVNLSHPDEILNHVQTGRSLSLLEEWILEAQLFYELLMQ